MIIVTIIKMQNPKSSRSIALIDVNNFYVSCERVSVKYLLSPLRDKAAVQFSFSDFSNRPKADS